MIDMDSNENIDRIRLNWLMLLDKEHVEEMKHIRELMTPSHITYAGRIRYDGLIPFMTNLFAQDIFPITGRVTKDSESEYAALSSYEVWPKTLEQKPREQYCLYLVHKGIPPGVDKEILRKTKTHSRSGARIKIPQYISRPVYSLIRKSSGPIEIKGFSLLEDKVVLQYAIDNKDITALFQARIRQYVQDSQRHIEKYIALAGN